MTKRRLVVIKRELVHLKIANKITQAISILAKGNSELTTSIVFKADKPKQNIAEAKMT